LLCVAEEAARALAPAEITDAATAAATAAPSQRRLVI
jgi:hypothetical protein